MSRAMTTDVDATTGEYGPLSRVCEILGLSPGAAKSAALTGAIRTRVIPGVRPKYNLDDARALAARTPAAAAC